MRLRLNFSPEGAGVLVRDGKLWQPELDYPDGSTVQVGVRPAPGYVFAGWSGDMPLGQADGVPMTLTLTGEPQTLTAHFVPTKTEAPELSVAAGFDNGNAIVRYIDHARRTVILEPAQHNGSVNIWWHCKIHGIEPGEFLTLETHHAAIAGDCPPLYSYDGNSWHRFNSARSPFIQRFAHASVEVARNIPYPYGRSLALATDLQGRDACDVPDVHYVEVSNLVISEEGREVKLLRVTDPTTDDRDKGCDKGCDKGHGKKVVWVQARLHAFESHASWVAEGLVRWLNTADPIAADLRRRAIVYVVPMMDVDSVFRGGAGKSQWLPNGEPGDLNRDWGEAPHWQVTKAAMTTLRALKETHDIVAFFDLHSPWYDNPPHVHLRREAEAETTLHRFLDSYREAVRLGDRGNVWNQFGWGWSWGWSKADEGQEERRSRRYEPGHHGPSTNWVLEQGVVEPTRGPVITFEIPHWKDDAGVPITKEGLLGYGEALGRAMNHFLGGPLK